MNIFKYIPNPFNGLKMDAVNSVPSGASSAVGKSVTTGALTANVTKTIAFGFTAANDVKLQAHDGNNSVECTLLKPNAINPTTHFDIKYPFGISAPGLTVKITGY